MPQTVHMSTKQKKTSKILLTFKIYGPKNDKNRPQENTAFTKTPFFIDRFVAVAPNAQIVPQKD
jgi:hypothetical protein